MPRRKSRYIAARCQKPARFHLGVVYEAEQHSLGRRVALKVLPRELSASSRGMARFKREARAAARMHHTNIVPVFEVGQDGDTAFYAMQLIQGQGLDLVIDDLKMIRREHTSRSGGKLPIKRTSDAAPSIAASLVSGKFHQEVLATEMEADPVNSDREPHLAFTETIDQKLSSTVSAALPGESEISTAETNRGRFHRSVAQIGIQTADALAYAHARGIIHRDIKPSNLILDAGGVVWVTDFGLAKTDDEAMTHTGDILGTMRYMSPERFQGRCDVRADVYSLGLTLYELLVLKPAFESPDRLKLIEMVRQSEPLAPRSIDPRIPRDLETIVLKSIDKDPNRRYLSAEELCEDLRRFVDDEPIKARRISLPERLIRWSRRNKVVAASLTTIATLLLLVTLGAVLAASHFRQQREQQSRLAKENKILADTNKEKQLEAEHARGVEAVARMAAEAKAVQDQAPVQSVLLAVKAAELGSQNQAKPQPIAHATLLNVTARIGGIPLFQHRQHGRVEFSQDGRWLVTKGWVVTPRLWDLTGDAPAESSVALGDMEGDVRISNGVISPDSRWFVGVVRNTLRLWDLRTENRSINAHILEFGHRSRFSISPDSRWLAAVGFEDSTPRLWSLRDGGLDAPPHALNAHTGAVTEMAFSPDGRWLCTGSRDHSVRLWNLQSDVPSAEPRELIGHSADVTSLVFNEDGSRLITGSVDTTARVWDLKSGDALVLSGHEAAIAELTLGKTGPSRSRLVTVSTDGAARLWNLREEDPTWSPLDFRKRSTDFWSVGYPGFTFSPDGKWLYTRQSDETARLWSMTSVPRAPGTLDLQGHRADIHVTAVSPDGRWLATGSADATVQLWNLQRVGPEESPIALRGHDSLVNSIAIGPDSRWLATGSWDGSTRLWDLSLENPASSTVLRGHGKAVTSLAVTPDSRWVVAGGEDHTVRLWDLISDYPAGKSVVLQGHERAVKSLTVSDRWILTGSADRTAEQPLLRRQ